MSQGKDVVLAYVDALNRGDVEGMCKLFMPDAVIHGLMGPGTVESFRPIWKNVVESLQEHLGVLIGFKTEDDWFDYRLENDPRFLDRIQSARDSLRAGRGVKLENLDKK